MASAPTNQLFVQQELGLNGRGSRHRKFVGRGIGGSRISGVVSIEGNNPRHNLLGLVQTDSRETRLVMFGSTRLESSR